MPSPDLIDFDSRFDEIVAQLRAAAAPAPDSLRARVRELAEPPAEPERPRFHLRGRRAALVLAPLCVLALLAGAAAVGLLTSSSGRRQAAQKPSPAPASTHARGGAGAAATTLPLADEATGQKALPQGAFAPVTLGRPGAVRTLPPSGRRLQHYEAYLRVRVRDQQALADATRSAMRWTRSFGGFVAAVQTASAEHGPGDATLTLRIPIGKVQEAVARFTSLGAIVRQQISIQDLQTGYNSQTSEIVQLRTTIIRLQEQLLAAPADRRPLLEQRLATAKARLALVLQQRKQTVRAGRLTSVSLELTTRRAAAAHHRTSGRIGRAVHNAWSVLALSIAGIVYLLIVASPLLVLVAAAIAARRLLRRREEARLLARA
jgi:hypothetical protein